MKDIVQEYTKASKEEKEKIKQEQTIITSYLYDPRWENLVKKEKKIRKKSNELEEQLKPLRAKHWEGIETHGNIENATRHINSNLFVIKNGNSKWLEDLYKEEGLYNSDFGRERIEQEKENCKRTAIRYQAEIPILQEHIEKMKKLEQKINKLEQEIKILSDEIFKIWFKKGKIENEYHNR